MAAILPPLSNWFYDELGLMDKLEMASDVVAVIAKVLQAKADGQSN